MVSISPVKGCHTLQQFTHARCSAQTIHTCCFGQLDSTVQAKMHRWHRQACTYVKSISRPLGPRAASTHLMWRGLACGGRHPAEPSQGTTAALRLIRGGGRAGGPTASVLNRGARSCQTCCKALAPALASALGFGCHAMHLVLHLSQLLQVATAKLSMMQLMPKP